MNGDLYRTVDIKNVLDEAIHGLMDKLIADPEVNRTADGEMVGNIRICRKFADDIIRTFAQKDDEYDARMAEWKAGREAEKNGTAS